LRAAAVVLLCFIAIGTVKHWRYPAFIDFNFARSAQLFGRLAPGASMTIPINPAGWEMTLVKK
jgi:hypothetical protein